MAFKFKPLGNEDTPANVSQRRSVIDNNLREVVRTCWMMLPEPKRTLEAVEEEIRTRLEHALKDMKHDPKSFFTPPHEPVEMGGRWARKTKRKRDQS